ncbi:MAG: hypothetical protein ACR2J8_08600 [Thermomicrobiales bacterium]
MAAGLALAEVAVHAGARTRLEPDALTWFAWAWDALLGPGLVQAVSAEAVLPYSGGAGALSPESVEQVRIVADGHGLMNQYVVSGGLPVGVLAVDRSGWDRLRFEVVRSGSMVSAARLFGDAGYRCVAPVIARVRTDRGAGFASGDSHLTARWYEPFDGAPEVLEMLAAAAATPDPASAGPVAAGNDSPGPTVMEYLRHIDAVLRPAVVLLLGSDAAPVFVRDDAVVVAIDLAPSREAAALARAGQIVLLREPAESACTAVAIGAVLEAREVDFVWIADERHFRGLLRAFIDCERMASPYGAIAIGHVLPRTAQAARRSPTPGGDVWSGEAWRIVPCLRRWRPNLMLDLHDATPDGILVVTGLDPADRTLDDRYDEIIAAETADRETYAADWQAHVGGIRR